MLTLPPEVQRHILADLSYPDLHSLSLTCSSLYDQVQTALQQDRALSLTCKKLVPWIREQQKLKYVRWREILTEICDSRKTSHTGAAVKIIDISSLARTHTFLETERRPQMHKDMPLVGELLFKPKCHVFDTGLFVSVEKSGHSLLVRPADTFERGTRSYRLDVPTLQKRKVGAEELPAIGHVTPEFFRESTRYTYIAPGLEYKFDLKGEVLVEVHALVCGSTLLASLVGVQSGGWYFLQMEADSQRPAVLFLPSSQADMLNYQSRRAEIRQIDGAVFAIAHLPGTQQDEIMFLDFEGHVIHRLFKVLSPDAWCPLMYSRLGCSSNFFMVRASDMFLFMEGTLVKVAVDFSSGLGSEVMSGVSHDSENHLTSNHVSSPPCHVTSVSSIPSASALGVSDLCLDSLLGKYAILRRKTFLEVAVMLLDLDNHVITTLHGVEILSLVSMEWSGEDGRSLGNGQIHVCQYTTEFLKGKSGRDWRLFGKKCKTRWTSVK